MTGNRILRPACAVLFALCLLTAASPAGSLVPDTGRFAIAQALLDVHSRLRVMAISLRPGDEDFAALAYLRLGKGARILSMYVTNGESGESDQQELMPAALGAARREAATAALDALDGDCVFLNFPDVAAARSGESVQETWPADSLRAKIRRSLQSFRPDVLILFRDWESGAQSDAVRRTVETALVKELGRTGRAPGKGGSAGPGLWSVDRLWVWNSRPGGVTVPVDEIHPFLKKSYGRIGGSLAGYYQVLSAQMRLRERLGQPAYQQIVPASGGKSRLPDGGPPRTVPKQLRALERRILSLNATKEMSEKDRDSLLHRVAEAIAEADRLLRSPGPLSAAASRIVVDWKSALERLRCSLLGVHVTYTLSESILAPRQLTYLKFDEVSGLQGGGTTEVYVPAAGRDWVLNEGMAKSVPLSLKDPLRLISPQHPEVNYPVAEHGMDRPLGRFPLSVFIVHRAPRPFLSFVYPITLEFYLADKLTVETLAPIVRAMPGEELVVRLTNHSRDGLASWLEVRDSLVTSPRTPFMLKGKESVWQDTLPLQFRGSMPAETFVVPITIEGQQVGAFAARSCVVSADSAKKVGLIVGVEGSATIDALRRAGFPHVQLLGPDSLAASTRGLDVVIVDHRAITFHPGLREARGALMDFARNGGHVLILAQEPEAWEEGPLTDGLHLVPDDTFDPESPVTVDTSDQLWRGPNRLSREDFEGWLFRRAYHRVTDEGRTGMEVPIRDSVSGLPLVVTEPLGQGRLTYTSLCLRPQWMNVSPGSLRILANLVGR